MQERPLIFIKLKVTDPSGNVPRKANGRFDFSRDVVRQQVAQGHALIGKKLEFVVPLAFTLRDAKWQPVIGFREVGMEVILGIFSLVLL